MPSKTRQVGVRLSPDNEKRLVRLRATMQAATGINVTVTDVVNAALAALEKYCYPSSEVARKGAARG